MAPRIPGAPDWADDAPDWATTAPSSGPSIKDMAIDAAKSLPAGVGKGLTGLAGAPGDLQSLKGSDYNPFNWLQKKAEENLPAGWTENSKKLAERSGLGEGMTSEIGLPTSHQLQSAVESKTGEFHKPETMAGEYAHTAGEFVPGLLTPGGIWRKTLMNWLAPAAATESAGQLTKGSEYEPYARLATAVATPGVLSRMRTPLNTAPGRAEMVDDLTAEGVTGISAGQKTGSKALQYAEGALGDYPGAGGKATQLQNAGQEQFTKAVLGRLGVPKDVPPTRQVLDARITELENNFSQLSARNTANLDHQFQKDLSATETRYNRKLDSQQKKIFYDILDDIGTHGTSMPGEVYQPLRADLTKMAFAAKERDPLFADAIRGVRDALDKAMGRSISALDRKLWEDTRKEWGNWKTIAAAAKNTDDAGHIRITPAALQAAASAKNREAFARGEGPYANLAQSGAPIMRPLPQSGTQPRHVAVAVPSAAAAGATAALMGHGSGESMTAILAGAAAPAVAGRALMSPWMQRYLANRGEMGQTRDSTLRALMRGIMATDDAREK